MWLLVGADHLMVQPAFVFATRHRTPLSTIGCMCMTFAAWIIQDDGVRIGRCLGAWISTHINISRKNLYFAWLLRPAMSQSISRDSCTSPFPRRHIKQYLICVSNTVWDYVAFSCGHMQNHISRVLSQFIRNPFGGLRPTQSACNL